MCRDALRGSRPDMDRRLAGVLPPRVEARPRQDENRRVLLTCTPHVGQVDLHYYRPPFGLSAYDPRFRNGSPRAAA
jgi:hypothetical protein